MARIRSAGVFLACVLSLLVGHRAAAQAAPVGGQMSDDLFRLRPGRGMRASSSDPDWRNGNGDARRILPGQTLTVADIEGPGVIRHLWFTINASDARYGRWLVLRIYWDDQEEPAVEAPFGDFFAVGHGLKRTVDSQMVSVTSEGRACNCYWPMPFARRARITLTNDAKKHRIKSAYFYVDYEKLPALPSDTAYFHARYRQEYPAEPGRNYLILDTKGAGHYVGTILSAYSRTPGWFGEGDDFFYVDGQAEPGLRGTGTEDYFCDAWGFRLFNRPYYGVTVFDGYELGDRVSVYRWHVPDPVRFMKSLRVEIEHKGEMSEESGKTISGFAERADLFSSVAFWYQTGTATRFATLPPLEQRLVPQTFREWGERLGDVAVTPAGAPVVARRGELGGNGVLVRAKDTATAVALSFQLEEPARGIARLTLGTLPEGGIWSVKLDDKPLPGLSHVDTYAAVHGSRELRLGYVDLVAGAHILTFESRPPNPSSPASWLAVDALTIDHLTPHVAKKP